MSARITLDHVAIAVERWADAWPVYAGALGGRWGSSGRGPGFAPSQLSYANGMRLEVLEPNDVHVNDFLRRFLDRNGPGPHHLTYKVGDIGQMLAALERAGVTPTGVDLRDPAWQEAFVHPRDGHGVVVQVAQSSGEQWTTPPPDGFPAPDVPQGTLLHVAHAVSDLDAALALFAGVLAGEESARGGDEAGTWVELAWPGPGRVRLVTPASANSPIAQWIGDRPGRVLHAAFALDDPARVPNARPLAGGAFEVAPAAANGLRLLLSPTREV